ncbi:hypothetical protein GOBAR_DD17895 [Gossypium barbadense]|nr:hypothetical protein GOBAR_DD17895 [Gossypium barbadense]
MAEVAPDPSPLIIGGGGETVRRPLPDSLHVNGGDGTYSYTRNSYFQRLAANVVKERIKGVITMKLDVENLFSTSNTIYIADLGCAVGPNAFDAMQDVVHFIQQKYTLQCPQSNTTLQFLVLFNDQPSNDFNTLFTSLPRERPYYAAGVPGSFHRRLFPESSIHFVHCSYALHWLSKDMEEFLCARAMEIVTGGMMTIIMPGLPNEMPYSQLAASLMYDFMASTFMDMENEGLVSSIALQEKNLRPCTLRVSPKYLPNMLRPVAALVGSS